MMFPYHAEWKGRKSHWGGWWKLSAGDKAGCSTQSFVPQKLVDFPLPLRRERLMELDDGPLLAGLIV